MLEIRGLTGGWGPTLVVEDFDLAIEAGETVALIGRGGARAQT